MIQGRSFLQINAVCLALSAGVSVQVAAQNQAPLPSKKLPSGAMAPQAPLTPQERLDAIRQSLIDASLQSPTRVSSTSWVDSQGSLRENSTFKNGMEVRGVKVLRFERDENGQAKASLQYPTSSTDAQASAAPATKPSTTEVPENSLLTAVKKLSSLVTDPWRSSHKSKTDESLAQADSSCTSPVGSRMNHVIGLEVQIDPNAPNALLQTLVPQIQTQWVQSNAQNGKANAWRAVNNLPSASMANSMTGYERALVGNRPETLPWQATLTVKTTSLPQSTLEAYLGAKNPNFFMTLEFQLVNTEGLPAQIEEEATLSLEIERSSWSAPKMTAASVAKIQQQLRTWRNSAHDWLNCHPLNPQVTAVRGQQLEINAGALSGVRKGDEWIVANPARFPAELMSKEGAPQTLLATVQSVSPHGSQLMVLAGPAQAVQANWRAWPTETLSKEPSILPSTRPSAPTKLPVKGNASASANFTLTPN